MKHESICKKMILAEKSGARVLYCEQHRVVEVEIGAMSLRLDVESFTEVDDLLSDAKNALLMLHESHRVTQIMLAKLKRQ